MQLRPQLSTIRARFGYPYHQWTTQEFDEEGWNLIKSSLDRRRAHDATLLIEGPDGRFVHMAKLNYPPGYSRSFSGIVKPGEDIAAEALREAREETGLNITLRRFLLHVTLDIGREDEVATWDSYVFHATTPDMQLKAGDRGRSMDTTWVLKEQLQGLARSNKESGKGGLMFRGDLLASAFWALDNKMIFREATPRDFADITLSLIANKVVVEKIEETFWWVAEVQGIPSGTVGITPHDDCAELTGVTVSPVLRSKGLGYALVEYACDQWHNPEKRKELSLAKKTLMNDKLWLISPVPAYFLPVNFVLTETGLLPESLRSQLSGMRTKWTAMRYQIYKF